MSLSTHTHTLVQSMMLYTGMLGWGHAMTLVAASNLIQSFNRYECAVSRRTGPTEYCGECHAAARQAMVWDCSRMNREQHFLVTKSVATHRGLEAP